MLELAKAHFDPEFSNWIEQRCLAPGKLGGKSIGLLLAWRILSKNLSTEMSEFIHIPTSYFVGSDEFVDFVSRYGDVAELIGNPDTEARFLSTPLSDELTDNLKKMLETLGSRPLIVRSSSILEDQYGSAFAGIYKSVFCPNQGDFQERLQQLELAIKKIYLSAFSADAINYRKKRGLGGHTDEMAVLIQTVEGRSHKNYHFPDVAGIAFSKNPYCWTDRLNPNDGFMRLVWGLGSKAVQSIPGNYPRLIGLTNPRLRPETSQQDLYHYSQHFFDAINLENGMLETLPVLPHLTDSYDELRLIASIVTDEGMREIKARLQAGTQPVITFQKLMENNSFINTISQCLTTLGENIGNLINIEFSANITRDGTVEIALLQCRQLEWEIFTGKTVIEPTDERVALKTDRFLYSGEKQNIEYLIMIDPVLYSKHSSRQEQVELVKVINILNEKLGRAGYFLSGPGRWGSTRPDLGVPVQFGDIYNAQILLEIHQSSEDLYSSTYGTHFFLDLVETKTALLAIGPDVATEFFQECTLRASEDLSKDYLRQTPVASECVKVYHLSGGHTLNLSASPQQGNALVYFSESR